VRKIHVQGDKLDAEGNFRKETLELWTRDLAEVARELVGDPAFKNDICYSFQPIFEIGQHGSEKAYNEMWTANWWQTVEVSLTYP
jgi:hypothetical protein